MFELDGTHGQRDFQWVGAEGPRVDLEPFTRKSFPQKHMVWVAFCSKGFLKPRFVEKNVKINSKYYIEKILKPMIREANALFGEGGWTLHQDNAPSHTAKATQEFLKNSGVNFITKDEWMPVSPDCSPCDYWLFGQLKRAVKRRPVHDAASLKRAVIGELKKIPLKNIEAALAAWPKRLRLVHAASGGHIENLRQQLKDKAK